MRGAVAASKLGAGCSAEQARAQKQLIGYAGESLEPSCAAFFCT